MISKKPIPMGTGHSDEFGTPEWAVQIILPFITKYQRVWECAYGEGDMAYYLWLHGKDVYGEPDIDFLSHNSNTIPDYCLHNTVIVTNPPYSIKDKFLIKAYDLGLPFAFLLPLTALEGRTRQKLYSTFGLELILFNKRVNFRTPSGEGRGAWFATAWFTHGLNIGKQITFVDVYSHYDY